MVHGLGERLQTIRKSKNLSQKDVANALGISAAVISNYENGGRTPSIEVLISLASFYRCSTDYLLGFEKHTPNTTLDVSMLSEEQVRLLQNFINSLE